MPKPCSLAMRQIAVVIQFATPVLAVFAWLACLTSDLPASWPRPDEAAAAHVAQQDAPEEQPAATQQLADLDLIALRKSVSQWKGEFAGGMTERVNEHAGRLQGIIDRLTILQRKWREEQSNNSPTAGQNRATAKTEIANELRRLHAMWPAWLHDEFDPPIAQRLVNVRTPAELQQAITDAQPGDEIILADGLWPSVNVTARQALHGTEVHPIVIRAQTPGRAIITGESSWRLRGENVIIRGLQFRGAGASRERRPALATTGRNVRISQCVFYAVHESGGVVLAAAAGRFDRNFVCGAFRDSAVTVAGDGTLIDGNYFGWRTGDEGEFTLSAGAEIQAGADHKQPLRVSETTIRGNLFAGDGATLLDAGQGTIIDDNTFQNVSGDAVLIAAGSREAMLRNNLLFNTGLVRIDSPSARLLDNYLELGRLSGDANFKTRNNTLVLPAQDSIHESRVQVAAVVPVQFKSGRDNLVCTENKVLWPTELQATHNGRPLYDSEEESAPKLLRDVLGYLRAHQRFGTLGFQGEALPLGRESDVGPAWLPTALAINRPLAGEFVTGKLAGSTATSSGAHLSEHVAADGARIELQVANNAFLSAESVQHSPLRNVEALPAGGWTLQGWLEVPSGFQGEERSLVIGENETGSWRLTLTADHCLELSGGADRADWAFSTASDFHNDGEAGRVYFAVIMEPHGNACEISFYRGSERDSVELVAAETMDALNLSRISVLEFVRSDDPSHGLINARLFAMNDPAEDSSGDAQSPFAVLNASDLESLRQGDVIDW